MPWTYVFSDLKDEKIVGTFYKEELQKINQKVFRVEKVIKTKGDELYLKWKRYNNLFYSWIDKKRLSIKEYFFFQNWNRQEEE